MLISCFAGSAFYRRAASFSFFAILLTFTFSAVIEAQPAFTPSALRLLKEKKVHPDLFIERSSIEESRLPASNLPNSTNLADGDLDPGFNASVTEGTGYVDDSVVQPDGKIIIAGLFQRVNGTRINNIARLNPDGSLDPGFNTGTGTNGAIRTIALQPDGKILLGGSFTNFNGQTVRRIVRLNANGSFDASFSTAVNFGAQVNDIVVLSDGKILVGGQFSVSASRLVRLNSDGTLSDAVPNYNSFVNKIAVQPDGKIITGGTSSNVFRRLNSDLSVDSTFTFGAGPQGVVYDIAILPDGKIVLGGDFTAYNGTPTDQVARINGDGSFDKAFEFLSDTEIQNSEVSAVAAQTDGKILVSYIAYGDEGYAGRIIRFNTNATIDQTFATGDMDQTYASGLTVLGDGKILVGGAFATFNNQTRLHIAKLNQDGTLDNAFNPAVSTTGIVYAIKRQADGKIVIAGDFEFVNGVKRTAMARLNADGTLDPSFALPSTGFYGDVYDFEIQPDGKIVFGGLFVGGQSFPAYYLARVNANGSFDNGFGTVNVNDLFIFPVYDVTLQPDNKILVGGVTMDTMSSNYFVGARFNADGTQDNGFARTVVPPGASVRAMAVQPSGKIIVGGTFISSFPNFQRTGLLRLNGDGTLDSAVFGGNANVFSIKQTSDGSIYAGGNSLTKHSAEGVLDSTLNIGTGVNNFIRAVEVQTDGKILIGGFFTSYNGTAVNRFARINPNGALDSTFSTANGAGGTVFAIALQSDNKILVGGQFLDFNGSQKFSIARLLNAPVRRAAPFDFDGDAKSDLSIFRPSVGEWWYSRSSDNQVRAAQFGSGTDKIVPADFSGDGRTDIAFWRPATGEWFILRSEDGSFYSVPFGAMGDVPVAGDFDADGKTDLTVFRPSSGTWFINKSTGGTIITTFGASGDVPVAADYDGDGKTDIAIFRPSDGSWWYVRSIDNQFRVFSFGVSTDKPVVGDYSGDGKADIAVYRPSTGEWFFQRSEDNSYYSVPFGAAGDIPTPGDFDGDGKFDTAVFRPSGSTWYVDRSSAGLMIQQFGAGTDSPVPAAFIP